MTSTHPKSPLSPALRERFGPSRKVRGSFSSSRCSFATSGEINFNSPGRRTPWVLYIDDSTHTAYYYNMMTGETSWRRPRHYVIHDSTLQFSPQSSVDQSPSTHLRSSSGIVFASPAEEKKIAAVVDRSGILQPVTPSNLKFPRLNSPHLHQESIKSPKFDHESNADFMFEGITLKEEMRLVRRRSLKGRARKQAAPPSLFNGCCSSRTTSASQNNAKQDRSSAIGCVPM